MTQRCVVCTQVEAVHPEVADGYTPHPFEPADLVRTETYVGPDRRHLVRRMGDRIRILRGALGEGGHDVTASAPERRHLERRAS